MHNQPLEGFCRTFNFKVVVVKIKICKVLKYSVCKTADSKKQNGGDGEKVCLIPKKDRLRDITQLQCMTLNWILAYKIHFEYNWEVFSMVQVLERC